MLDWARLSLKSLLASWEEWNLLSVILVFWCCYCFGPPLGFIWKKNYNINYVLYHLIYCEVTLLFKALWFQLFFIMWIWRVALGTGCQTVKRVSGSEFWFLHNNRVCFLPLVQHEVGLLALQDKKRLGKYQPSDFEPLSDKWWFLEYVMCCSCTAASQCSFLNIVFVMRLYKFTTLGLKCVFFYMKSWGNVSEHTLETVRMLVCQSHG